MQYFELLFKNAWAKLEYKKKRKQKYYSILGLKL